VSEKGSNREAFLSLKNRLEQSVELFRSLKHENLELRRRLGELESRLQDVTADSSRSQREVARLLSERKQVRDKVERILEAVSRIRSAAQG
jgi:regulator of replication initiation timing